MSTSRRFVRPALTGLATAVLMACGGGGGGSAPGAPTTPTAPRPAPLAGSPAVTMNCVAEPVFAAAGATTGQCSGATALRTDNGVTITPSGVQAYGTSTSDLAATNPDNQSATGFRLVAGIPEGASLAEVRLGKQANGTVSRAFLLLDNLGVRWDGTNERPKVVEAFDPTTGITRLEGDGSITVANTLPAPPNAYYNWVDGPAPAGDVTRYANNRYFAAGAGCAQVPPTPSATEETCGLSFVPGTGSDPARSSASRRHGDGDIRAGNPGGLANSGTKGFRNLTNFGYTHANIATWIAQETSWITEWTPSTFPGQEYTVNRRGALAYGSTTGIGAVPAAGTAIYSGIAYGFYTPNGDAANTDPIVFRATATMLADFASGQVLVEVKNAVQDGSTTSVPITFVVNAGVGLVNTNVANYLTGPIASGGAGMAGGLGGRFFGPAAEEIAGTIVLQNATTKAAVLGGFIGRR